MDGLRGVSVLAVLAFHSRLLPGGFLGVDVFFALSGFLITTLLLEEEAAHGWISFASFYVRRALRLLPALMVFVTVWSSVLLLTVPAAFVGVVVQLTAAVVFYAANWVAVAGVPLGIFTHTWSLAIEEQFYLLWPVAAVAAVRLIRRPRLIAAGVLAAAIASSAWRSYLAADGASWTRIYMASDAHADGLFIGAALAFWMASGRGIFPGSLSRVWIGAASGVALLALLVGAPLVPSYAWGAATATAIATVGVIAAVVSPGVGRGLALLRARPLVATGRISYALYLWHYPIFYYCGALDVGGTVAGSYAQVAAAWLATILVASASYFFIERPALGYKSRYARNLTGPLASARPSTRAATAGAPPSL